ncbi:hypothetical protein LINGRAHAP2_LOCUS30780 [Linum grandiflorum]
MHKTLCRTMCQILKQSQGESLDCCKENFLILSWNFRSWPLVSSSFAMPLYPCSARYRVQLHSLL